jgi:integrase
MIYTFICRRCDDLPVAACCRVMGVSTSGFYAWRACPVTDRDWNDAVLTNTIVDIHRASRASYGSPRVHAERYRALILTAGLAGLRQGELFGLRQADVDLRRATITIRRKRLRLASGQVIEDEPKSRAGRRSVALPAALWLSSSTI